MSDLIKRVSGLIQHSHPFSTKNWRDNTLATALVTVTSLSALTLLISPGTRRFFIDRFARRSFFPHLVEAHDRIAHADIAESFRWVTKTFNGGATITNAGAQALRDKTSGGLQFLDLWVHGGRKVYTFYNDMIINRELVALLGDASLSFKVQLNGTSKALVGVIKESRGLAGLAHRSCHEKRAFTLVEMACTHHSGRVKNVSRLFGLGRSSELSARAYIAHAEDANSLASIVIEGFSKADALFCKELLSRLIIPIV